MYVHHTHRITVTVNFYYNDYLCSIILMFNVYVIFIIIFLCLWLLVYISKLFTRLTYLWLCLFTDGCYVIWLVGSYPVFIYNNIILNCFSHKLTSLVNVFMMLLSMRAEALNIEKHPGVHSTTPITCSAVLCSQWAIAYSNFWYHTNHPKRENG